MHPLIHFAWKNIFKSKTRSGLAILAVILGVLLITTLLVLTDSLVASVDDSLDLLSNVVVIKEKNSFDPTMSLFNLSILNTIIEDNNSNSEIHGLIASYSAELWYVERSDTGLYGFTQVIGTYPSKEIETVGIISPQNIVDGRTLNDDDLNASVIGTTFALGTGAKVGDYITVANKKVKVVGIFNTGSFIDTSIFMPINVVRGFRTSYKDNVISTILLKPKNLASSGKIIDFINDKYEQTLNIEATDFDDMAAQGRKFLEITTDFAFNIGIISIIIGSLSVFNAMLMSVMERKREIAVLKALGWSDREVGIEVFTESLVISLIGGIIGMIGGIAIAIYVTQTSEFLKLSILPLTLLKSFTFAVLLGTFAGFYPAARAMRIDPIIDLSEG